MQRYVLSSCIESVIHFLIYCFILVFILFLFIMFFSWTSPLTLVAGLNLLILDCTQCLSARLESASRSHLIIMAAMLSSRSLKDFC